MFYVLREALSEALPLEFPPVDDSTELFNQMMRVRRMTANQINTKNVYTFIKLNLLDVDSIDAKLVKQAVQDLLTEVVEKRLESLNLDDPESLAWQAAEMYGEDIMTKLVEKIQNLIKGQGRYWGNEQCLTLLMESDFFQEEGIGFLIFDSDKKVKCTPMHQRKVIGSRQTEVTTRKYLALFNFPNDHWQVVGYAWEEDPDDVSKVFSKFCMPKVVDILWKKECEHLQSYQETEQRPGDFTILMQQAEAIAAKKIEQSFRAPILDKDSTDLKNRMLQNRWTGMDMKPLTAQEWVKLQPYTGLAAVWEPFDEVAMPALKNLMMSLKYGLTDKEETEEKWLFPPSWDDLRALSDGELFCACRLVYRYTEVLGVLRALLALAHEPLDNATQSFASIVANAQMVFLLLEKDFSIIPVFW
jgi:hypothetical protein